MESPWKKKRNNTMISELEQIILKNVDVFLENTAKEFDVPLSKLKENWRTHLGLDVPVKKVVKKTSPYQNFFVQKRTELLKSHSELQFGDLSSQISKMWNAMTKEEQKVYSTAKVEAPLPLPPPPPPLGLNFETLNKKTMPELRKLCEEKGLKRTGNKMMLIHNLLGITAPTPAPTVIKKPLVMAAVEENEDVEVITAKNMKRSDIEEAITFPEEIEEEDFEYEEGSNYSVHLEEED
jgi:hypothetical protein